MSLDVEVLQPWLREFYDSFGVLRLHEEISDFCYYIKPTVLEGRIRLYVVEKLKKVIMKQWPSATVHVFGSFATGLYLPTSDIDIVVIGEWKSSPMRTLERILRENDVSSEIRVIEKATVPIVKMIEKDTGIFVDISFNKDNGIKTIPIIHEYLAKYPHLRELFLILKQFMLQRDLNEVWTGGIGSYSLMLLCISFFQHYNKNFSGNMNLGCLLMEFLELYGRCFNFLQTGISVAGRGSYKMKYDNPKGQKISFISIDDPIDKDNDVGRSCYGLFNIRSAFSNAYCKLHGRTVPACVLANRRPGELVAHESILASIISVSADTVEFRDRLSRKFRFLLDWDEGDVLAPLTVSNCVREYQHDTLQSRRKERRRNVGHRGKVGVVDWRRRLPKKAIKRMNKAYNWSDLAEWSQDNVFKYHT